MKKTFIILSAIVLLTICGCTENQRAKKFGGNMTINLPANQKLVNVTFKDADMWYLTRPMRSNELAETSLFKEKSNYGMVEGSVTFVESK